MKSLSIDSKVMTNLILFCHKLSEKATEKQTTYYMLPNLLFPGLNKRQEQFISIFHILITFSNDKYCQKCSSYDIMPCK